MQHERSTNERNERNELTPRVLANVHVLTWVPSTMGRVNTTDKHIILVNVWVNAPNDDRYKPEDRGGEQAIAIAKRRLAADGIECLAVMGLGLTDLVEKSIVNQPRGLSSADDLNDATALDLGLKLV